MPMPGSACTATSPSLLAVTLGVLFALLGVLPSLSVPSPRLEVFSELHKRHCQHSATALTHLGKVLPQAPTWVGVAGDNHSTLWEMFGGAGQQLLLVLCVPCGCEAAARLLVSISTWLMPHGAVGMAWEVKL